MKNNKLCLEWFNDQLKDNVFCFEINKNDFYILKYEMGLIFQENELSFICGKPIRVKKNGDISVILNDFCECCGSALVNIGKP